MFVGNYDKALQELTEVILQGIKKGWHGGREGCCPWTSGASGERALETVRGKAFAAAQESLLDFEALPIDGWLYIGDRQTDSFPRDKILTLTLANVRTIWNTESVHVRRKLKSIKSSLEREFELLVKTWRHDDYVGKKEAGPVNHGRSRKGE